MKGTRTKTGVQRALHCRFGRQQILALGLCSTCYSLKRQDEEYFGGLREQVLERDGWLLLDTHDEVREILRWGNASEAELVEHETNIRRWGTSTVVMQLSRRQFDQLIDRGKSWPWNGYELRKMKLAGKYPPKRMPVL